MVSPRHLDLALMGAIVAVLLASIVFYIVDETYFWQSFAAEDGLIEYATALFLLVAGLILVRNARALSARGRRGAAALTCAYALLFVFAAGEEISWGQRIFDWESGEFFRAHNKQAETNLHNLVIGDVHLAETLFGSILTTVLLLYLVALPLCYNRIRLVTALADRLAVPVPGLRHAVMAVLASIVLLSMTVYRKWEVYEFVFSVLAVSIFLFPQNRDKVAV